MKTKSDDRPNFLAHCYASLLNLARYLHERWGWPRILTALALCAIAIGMVTGCITRIGKTSPHQQEPKLIFETTEHAPCGFADAQLYPAKAGITIAPNIIPSEVLRFRAFGRDYIIDVTQMGYHPTYRTLFGTIRGHSESYCLLVQHQGTYSGLIGAEGTTFSIKGCGGSYGIALVNPLVLPLGGPEERMLYELIPASDTTCEPKDLSLGDTIDVMILYTAQAQAMAGKDAGFSPLDTLHAQAAIETEIMQALEVTNMAFADSRIPVTFRLVRTQCLGDSPDWETEGTLRQTLHQLECDPQVGALRDEYAADLVSLMVEGGTDCGFGNHYFGKGASSRAFSVVRRNCASTNYSLAHELGHNLGLDHHCGNSTRNGPGHGYCFRTSLLKRVQTIMATEEGHTRIPFFSDADRGRGTKPRSGPAKECFANEVEVLLQTAPAVALYRCRKPFASYADSSLIHHTSPPIP